MTLKSKISRKLILTSIITTIVLTFGIGIAFAVAPTHFEGLIVGEGTGSNANDASGWSSVAIGTGTTASGDDSFASGQGTIANTLNSFAAGLYTTSSGEHSASFGAYTNSEGDQSFASGHSTTTLGPNSFTAGVATITNGSNSAAFGDSTVAQSESSFVIGRHNEGLGDPAQWNDEDPLFVIGNGDTSVMPPAKHNAVTVLKNGNLGMGTSTPNSQLEVTQYIELATSEGIPPYADCDAFDEVGRMKVDQEKPILYICTNNSSWVLFTPYPTK